MTERIAFSDPDRAQQSSSERDDEISLIDIWLYAKKYRKILLLTTLLGLFAGVTYLYLTKPLYRSSVVIQIGTAPINSNNSTNIEPINLLIQRLREEYNLNENGRGQIPRLESVVQSKTRPEDVIVVTAIAETPNMAVDYLTAVIQKVKEGHDSRLLELMQLHSVLLNSYQKQKLALDKQIESLDRQIQNLKAKNSFDSAWLVLEKARIVTESISLEEKIVTIEMNLSPINNRPTRVLGAPSQPKAPYKPRYAVVIFLALFVGLVLGMIVALFLESLAGSRRQLSSPAA